MPHIFEWLLEKLVDLAGKPAPALTFDFGMQIDCEDGEGTRVPCMQGAVDPDLLRSGLARSYRCVGTKTTARPNENDLPDEEGGARYMTIDRDISRGSLLLQDWPLATFALAKGEQDRIMNRLGSFMFSLSEEDGALREVCHPSPIYFYWLLEGTRVLCGPEIARRGDVMIVHRSFLAHMRPDARGIPSVEESLRAVDASRDPVLERARRRHVDLLLETARDLATLGLPSELRRKVFEMAGKLC